MHRGIDVAREVGRLGGEVATVEEREDGGDLVARGLRRVGIVLDVVHELEKLGGGGGDAARDVGELEVPAGEGAAAEVEAVEALGAVEASGELLGIALDGKWRSIASGDLVLENLARREEPHDGLRALLEERLRVRLALQAAGREHVEELAGLVAGLGVVVLGEHVHVERQLSLEVGGHVVAEQVGGDALSVDVGDGAGEARPSVLVPGVHGAVRVASCMRRKAILERSVQVGGDGGVSVIAANLGNESVILLFPD